MINDTAKPSLSNGPAGAAILAAAVGCFTIGLLQLAADISSRIGKALVFYKGSGALSGETTVAIVIWLSLWLTLNRMWRRKTIKLGMINAVALALLLLGVALTFPPLVDVMK